MARRAAKGMGSVYELTITRRDGTTYQVWKAEYKGRTRTARTKREAASKLITLRGEVDAPVRSEVPKLAAYAAEWLETVVRHRAKPGTVAQYEQKLRLHILPVLGDRRLNAITVRDVQQLQSGLLDGGLKPSTVAVTLTVLGSVLNRAEASDLIAHNPIRRMIRAKVPRRDPAPIEPVEALAILRACREPWLSTAVHLALYLGLREGETLGLRWSDIDLERGRLTVAGQWTGKTWATTKNERTKTLPLPAPVATALRAQRAYLAETRLRAGALWAESDYVFRGVRGVPPFGNEVYRRFKNALKAAGLSHRTYHELRHGTATLLAAQGVPERVIGEILGHADTRTTSRVYTQVSEATMRAALERLEQVLEG